MLLRNFLRIPAIFTIAILLLMPNGSVHACAKDVAESPVLSDVADGLLTAWLLGEDKLPAPQQTEAKHRQNVLWGQSASGGRWLLIHQTGRLPEKLQLVQCEPAQNLEPTLLRLGIAEMLRLTEGWRLTDCIFSTAFLWLQDVSEKDRAEMLANVLPETPCRTLELRYGEQPLRLAANSDVVLGVVARTAAELGIAIGLDPLVNMGLTEQHTDVATVTLALSGGGRSLFDLTLRLLYRLDGQDLPAMAQGLGFSFWGQVLNLDSSQRFWLPFWALGGCLVALLSAHGLYRGVALLWTGLTPLATLLVGFFCRFAEAARFADICFLWLSCAVLLLLLPVKLRRLLCLFQVLLLLPLINFIWNDTVFREELLTVWLLLQLLWGITLWMRPNRVRS